MIDNGLGIPQKEQERLFQPYYRSLDPDQNQNVMSHGLGLYVSKRIMECLDGTLMVKSIPGVKTVFKL